MPIEPVAQPREPEATDPLFKLVVPAGALSAAFLKRAQHLLEDAPDELTASFEAALRDIAATR
jgi:hypothetical protein